MNPVYDSVTGSYDMSNRLWMQHGSVCCLVETHTFQTPLILLETVFFRTILCKIDALTGLPPVSTQNNTWLIIIFRWKCSQKMWDCVKLFRVFLFSLLYLRSLLQRGHFSFASLFCRWKSQTKPKRRFYYYIHVTDGRMLIILLHLLSSSFFGGEGGTLLAFCFCWQI